MDNYTNFRSIKCKWLRFSCEDIIPKYNCKYCEFTTDLLTTLNAHRRRLHNLEETDFKINNYTCNKCDFRSYSSLVWLTHRKKCTYVYVMKKNVGHMSDENITTCYIGSKLFFFCKVCEHKSQRHHNLQQHFLRRHTDPENRIKYKCNQCSFESVEKNTFRRHIIRVHTNPEKIKWYECDQCEYKTKMNYNLIAHNKTKHPSENQVYHVCNHCSYKAFTKSQLKIHMIARHVDFKDIKWFNCDQCNYKAKEKKNLNRHIKRKHASGSVVCYECDQCTYKSISKTNLRNHITARHTDLEEIKWFKCDQCEYKAKVKTYLNAHIKMKHKEIHWFECDKCEFRSRNKYYFKRHVSEKHTLENLVECSQCSFKATRANLDYHVFAHHTESDEINKFRCNRCNYTTKFKQDLSRHFRLKHSVCETITTSDKIPMGH